MHEVPKILMAFAIPQRDSTGPEEGLVFAVRPDTGDLVVQLAVTEERMRSFTFERPPSFPIPAQAALELAHEILRHYAPEVMDALERSAQRAKLSLVLGGAGPEAA